MTNADSDLSESPPVRTTRRRIGDEDEGPRSPMVGCVLAERASWQDSSGGRFAVLAEDDTESITNNSPDQCEEEGATDQEFPARRRRRLSITRQEDSEVHEHCMDRAVRGAEALIGTLARRIGAVAIGGPVPSAILRQRWSALNVPIIWGAAGAYTSILFIEWLVSRGFSIHAPVHFHGGQSSVSDSIRIGWIALREVMTAWGVTAPEELSTWLRIQGFLATRHGQHLSVRAQEFIFHEGCVLDARVALLETAFVSIIGARSCKWNSTSEQCGSNCNQKNSNQRHPSRGPTRELGTVGRSGLV